MRRALALAACLAGCVGGEPSGAPAPPVAASPADERSLETPRLSPDGRAVHARSELDGCARELLGKLAARGEPGRPPRVAVYRVTQRGREDHLGEWLATNLTTALVEQAAGRCEVYTRRKLSRVLEEWKFQATGLVDPATLCKAGRVSGVDGVVVGSLELDQGSGVLRLNLEVLDVGTAEVMAASRLVLKLGPIRTARPVGDREGAIRALAEGLGAGLAAGSGEETVLACYDVTRGGEPWEGVGSDLIRAVKGRLDDQPGVKALDRHEIETLLGERKLQLALGERGEEQAAGFVGARAIVAGSGALFERHAEVDLFVIDVESARILAAAGASFRRDRPR